MQCSNVRCNDQLITSKGIRAVRANKYVFLNSNQNPGPDLDADISRWVEELVEALEQSPRLPSPKFGSDRTEKYLIQVRTKHLVRKMKQNGTSKHALKKN